MSIVIDESAEPDIDENLEFEAHYAEDDYEVEDDADEDETEDEFSEDE